MATKATTVAPELRARAVRMVFGHRGDHASAWAAITSIAAKIGGKAETLRLSVRQTQRDRGLRDGMTTNEAGPIEGSGT